MDTTTRATREELEPYAEQGFFARTSQFSEAELEQMWAAAERAHQRLVDAAESNEAALPSPGTRTLRTGSTAPSRSTRW